jgi:cbb3-type cytochrome c oxidase subunit III
MRRTESYVPFLSVALVLTVGILVTFQLYLIREPDRISSVEAHDQQVAVSAGQALFKANCTLCHGDNGEGTPGRPALNDKGLLSNTSDDTLFSLISSGVPNTEMPAWNQSHGGPLTDENVRQVVAFLRAWEPTAPDRKLTPQPGDPGRGKTIFTSVCAACHGKSGEGNDRGPALNDPAKLNQFDDAWYRNVINNGRPAQGMPTWGSVLSPTQVNDVIALIDTWRASHPPTSVPTATPATF